VDPVAFRAEQILYEEPCPRCNATAKVRTRRKSPGSDVLLVKRECAKCRRVSTIGYTTEAALRRGDGEGRWI